MVQIISHSFIQYILDTDINMVCKENGQFDAMYLLLYYYYGGCIYSALKKFDRALFFFEVSPVSRRWNELHTWLLTNTCPGLRDHPHSRGVPRHAGGVQEVPAGGAPRAWRQAQDIQGE